MDKIAGECYITTVKDFPTVTGKERIDYVYEKNVWGFGYGARRLTSLEEGDKICFYLPSTKSVVLHGIVASKSKEAFPPERWELNDVNGRDYYNTELELINVKYVKPPVLIQDVKEKLGLPNNWGNFVIQTHIVDPAEFNILIGLD